MTAVPAIRARLNSKAISWSLTLGVSSWFLRVDICERTPPCGSYAASLTTRTVHSRAVNGNNIGRDAPI